MTAVNIQVLSTHPCTFITEL